jgi:hypothetical protein
MREKNQTVAFYELDSDVDNQFKRFDDRFGQSAKN